MVSQRLAGVPMENNGAVAVPDGDGLTLWVSHQAPHAVHAGLRPGARAGARAAPGRCPWVGGGFGPKAADYVEHIVAAKAALSSADVR